MKYFLGIILFLWGLQSASSLNNQIYFNSIYGLIYQPPVSRSMTDPYNPAKTHYLGANIGWHGVFDNKKEYPWKDRVDSYNLGILTELGYYRYVDGEDPGSLKASAGLSVGQYFVWYIKPAFFYQFANGDPGLSASIGLKINTFINNAAIAFGIGSDIPIPGVGNGMYPERSAGFYITFDMLYDINRTKKKNVK